MSRCPYTLPTSHSIYRCRDDEWHGEEHTVMVPSAVESQGLDLPNPPQCPFRIRQRGTNRYFRCREDPDHEGDHRLGVPRWYVVPPVVVPR